MSNYRKIYEEHQGKIPKDTTGRSYEIHHIDGNHTNNTPSNLIAVTLEEHYNIHYSQGDYGACRLMLMQRLKYSPIEFKELVSKQQKKRIANGTHQFTNSKWQRQNQLNLIKSGKHRWLSEEHSKHNSERQQILIKTKKHPLLGGGVTRQQLANGKHSSQIKKTCEHCGITCSSNNYNKWHGNNCKTVKPRKTYQLQSTNTMISCMCCKKTVSLMHYGRYHGIKCKV